MCVVVCVFPLLSTANALLCQKKRESSSYFLDTMPDGYNDELMLCPLVLAVLLEIFVLNIVSPIVLQVMDISLFGKCVCVSVFVCV